MANGDPMRLETRHGGDVAANSNWTSLILNGNFEYWGDTSALADGWIWTNAGVGSGDTYTRTAGARTSGVGNYYQRLQINASGAGTLGWLQQSIALPGDPALAANGHDNQEIKFRIWIQEATGGASCTFTIALRFFDAAGNVVQTGVSGALSPNNTWQEFTNDVTLTHDDIVRMDVFFTFTAAGAGAIDLRFDDAQLYFEYTFNRNPSLPDQGSMNYPGIKFEQDINGGGRIFVKGGKNAKHDRTLAFGNINQAQYEAFRHLWLLHAGMTLYPFHSLLPANLAVHWINQFNFALRRTMDTGICRGAMVLRGI